MRFVILLCFMIAVAGEAFAAGGKNRGDDPFGNPGDNPCFDDKGLWVCGDRPSFECVAVTVVDDTLNCVPASGIEDEVPD